MIRTRVVVTTALIAASAMILAACGSSPGQSTGTTSASSAASSAAGSASSAASSPASAASSETGGASSSSSAASSSGTGGTSPSASATATSAAPAGSNGCGTPHGPYTQPSGDPTGTVVTGLDELATSYNTAASHTNSIYNSVPAYLTQANGFYYDDKLNLVNDDSFITCVVTSQSPLTIKYVINPDAKWSDGVPITADDLLLTWISGNGKFNTGELKTDDNGNPIAQTNIVAFDTASVGMALITQMPVVSGDDRKTLTVTYSKPFVDYNLGFGTAFLPAHIVGEKALGISDPTQAVEAIQTAATKDDKASLAKIANTWNTGFDFTSLPTDKSLYLSSGAYLLTDFKENQYMTFTANPAYTWGPKPTVKTITYQYLNNATTAVQAVANGEVNMIWPQHPTADLSKGLQALSGQGVKTLLGPAGAYEHLDISFNNKGPFDKASYGGDDAKANDVRQAFLKTIPRQDILDRIIKPVDPSATLRNSFTQPPGAPLYSQMVAANGMSAFDKVDIAGAKSLLAQAGVTSPKVRIMYSATSVTRQQEFQLIQQSAQQAGFQVIGDPDPKWSSNLGNTGKYDAVIFGWINTSLGISQIPPNFLSQPAGQNNFGGYSNKEVDGWMNTLNVTADPSKQAELLQNLEVQLVKDGFGSILYQDPDVVGYDSNKVTGVISIPLAPGPFWDFWDWKATS